MYNFSMNMKLKSFVLSALFLAFMLSPFLVVAQGQDPGGTNCPAGQLCNPIKVKSFPLLIKTILEAMIKIGIPIIALAIIYSGFLFVSARGNTEQLKNVIEQKGLANHFTFLGFITLLFKSFKNTHKESNSNEKSSKENFILILFIFGLFVIIGSILGGTIIVILESGYLFLIAFILGVVTNISPINFNSIIKILLILL